jgi:hypothetical protein
MINLLSQDGDRKKRSGVRVCDDVDGREAKAKAATWLRACPLRIRTSDRRNRATQRTGRRPGPWNTLIVDMDGSMGCDPTGHATPLDRERERGGQWRGRAWFPRFAVHRSNATESRMCVGKIWSADEMR